MYKRTAGLQNIVLPNIFIADTWRLEIHLHFSRNLLLKVCGKS